MLNGTGKGLRILKVRMGAGGVGMREETGKNGEYYGLSLGFSLAPVTTCTCVLLYSQQNNAIHSSPRCHRRSRYCSQVYTKEVKCSKSCS